ncbi:TetR/AcrR family transcriptional regulator [Microlunatus soli]|uniref:DNA-binding transcriptional regulator, AcrR family n=1 Tax=Microlunatus soli TaxID=630515 RepID=A0A1H1QT78_9ACTN|nr:TetR/AcrR family transcriptional regulator [Microlunatus soli]SDS26634.1 DNA-binding transcriptional regulator, AcrR family [Microlunatus soli]
MAPRDRWIDEGFVVLREQGATGLKVDSIAARLGLTKGSFHHHFRGAGDYRRVLLARYEEQAVDAIEQFLAAAVDLAPDRAVMSLADAPVLDNRLDAAIRSWAADDADALAVQQRVDQQRLAALIGLWERILPDPQQARIAALVPHLVVIGASAAQPAPTEQEMRQVFELLAGMVPSIGDQVG